MCAIKEIGSEFWSVPVAETPNHFWHPDTQWFLSGRSALVCLLESLRRENSIETAALPAWCCDSMIKPFTDAGIRVQFYPTYFENGRFVQDYSVVDHCDLLFLMDYFGYSGYSNASKFDGIRIRDLTHSVFSGTYDDTPYCFGSLRKWAGFLTGGFGRGISTSTDLSDNDEYIHLRRSAMKDKEVYIAGLTNDKNYLSVFNHAEEILDHCAPAASCAEDISRAAFLDIDFIRQRRRENAAYLLQAFSDMAIFPVMNEQDCPLFVPILVPDGQRDALRRYLINQQIYCPVHWPLTELHQPDKKTKLIYSNELSLICDQRYSLDDMERIVSTIKEFWKG